MAQLIDLGKIRFSYRGEWSSATTYEYNDVVKYGGNIYAYTYATATNVNLPTNTTYWSLMLRGFDFQGVWSSSAGYTIGEIVTYGGKVFLAVSDTETTDVPGTSADWQELSDGVEYEGEYASGTAYQKNDIVKHGGRAYIAKVDTTGNTPPNSLYWDIFVDGIQYEGEYDSATTYQINDIVTYGGIVYVATSETTDNLPTDTNYWAVLTEGFDFKGEYDNGTTYKKNDVVSYGGSTFVAITSTVGNLPTDTNFWAVFADGTFPNQSGNENAVLSTNGSNTLWTQDISVDTVEATENLYVGESAKSQWENSGAKTYTVTNKSKTNDIVTLTTATNHTLGEFQFINVALDPADADFDGEYEIIDVTANTLTYEAVGSDVSSTSTGGTVSAVTGYTNSVAHFFIDADDYAQISFRNASDAVNASTDIIAYANNGDDFAGYIDMGITSENFGDPEFTITGANDGYIFMDAPVGTTGAGNLVLATGARGTENKIVFAAGGLDSDSTQMEITPDLNVHIEIPTPSTDPTTGALTVVGGVGIQGDMNIQGNVDIVGEISFGGSGTTVTTQNLAVSDPVIFAGSNNLSDSFDLGLVGEYAEDVADQVTSVTNKALTSNVATLTTSTNHGYSVGDVVVITDVDTTFNGTYVIKATPGLDTFTYDKTAGNVSSTAVSPAGTATVTHERRWAGVVRDVSDSGKIKFFRDLTEKPTNTIDFSNPGLSFAPIQAGAAELTSVTATNITTSAGTLNLGGTVNISSSANFTGADVTLGSGTWSGTPTFSGNVIFSGDPSFTGTPAFTGGVRIQELIEDVIDTSLTSNAATLDYQSGNIFYLSSTPSGAMTFNVTNAPTTDGRVFTVNVFVTQGSTGYIPSTMTINGSAASIRWANGTTPTATSSSGKIDIFNFTIVRRSGAFTVLASANLNF